MKVTFACAITIALVASSLLINYKKFNNSCDEAYAASDNVSNYIEAKAALEQVNAEYNSIMSQAAEINAQVEDACNQVMAVQGELVEKQKQLRDIIKYEYINSTQFSLISAMINSDGFDDFLKSLDYANSVMDFQYRIAVEQQQRKDRFESVLKSLKEKSSQQNACIEQANNKLSEASKILDSARSILTPAELAELEGEIPGGGGSEGGGGGGDEPGPGPDPGPQPDPPDPGPTWESGTASAYGGATDPSTGPISWTATGEICDDSSTGCAVPMSWPNYRSYFHRYVLISWNGMTIMGKCNDCGSMGGGSRSLDLQPGLWRAFGFDSCNAWGLRWVDYQWV